MSDNNSSEITVRVKDLISYFQKLDPEAVVNLDKDGWMQEDFKAKDAADLIKKRGLFDQYTYEGEPFVTINN